MTSEASRSATSSPGSEGGATPCGLPDGTTLDLFGQEVAPASRSAQQERAKGPRTSVTFGLTSSGSSASAALSLALASRLQVVTRSLGLTMFQLTWKGQRTPSGRSLPRLRATALRTSGTGSTGWPTPMAGTPAQNGNNAAGNNDYSRKVVDLAGWPTTTKQDASGSRRHGYMNDGMERAATKKRREVLTGHSGTTLLDAARTAQSNLSSWATPSARDHKDSSDPATWNCTEERDRMDQLPRQVFGAMPTGSHAETGKPGQLNPALSRWLMGYPPEWDDCAVTAMQSSPRRPRRSSARSSR